MIKKEIILLKYFKSKIKKPKIVIVDVTKKKQLYVFIGAYLYE